MICYWSNSYVSKDDIFIPGFLSQACSWQIHWGHVFVCMCWMLIAAAGCINSFNPETQLIHLSTRLTITAPSLSPHNLNIRTSLSFCHPPRRLVPSRSDLPQWHQSAVCQVPELSRFFRCVFKALWEALAFPPGWRWLHGAVVSPDNAVIVLDGMRQSCC